MNKVLIIAVIEENNHSTRLKLKGFDLIIKKSYKEFMAWLEKQ